MMSKELPPLTEEQQRLLDAMCNFIADGFEAGVFGSPAHVGPFKKAPDVTAEQVRDTLPKLIRQGMFKIVLDESKGAIRPEPTARGRKAVNAAIEIAEWISAPMKLQRTYGTRFHDLRTAVAAEEIVDTGSGQPQSMQQWSWEQIGVFVVEHDWAAAFERADLGEMQERKAPYPLSCFELTISGKRVCAVLDESADSYVVAVLTKEGWLVLNGELEFFDYAGLDYSGLLPAIASQVDAILVALDSGVATTSVLRASLALNKARAKKGKLPVYDYHAVKLARRSRPEPLPDGAPPGERQAPRLHFRRGHWRHLTHHKVWVNWTLVGDPDLGFIDKHYRL